MESLDKLEERISKAVSHIEKLNDLKKTLEEENTRLKERVSDLEHELESQKKKLSELEKDSARMSERVKEKVEGLLDRIENYEQSLS